MIISDLLGPDVTQMSDAELEAHIIELRRRRATVKNFSVKKRPNKAESSAQKDLFAMVAGMTAEQAADLLDLLGD